MFLRSAPRVKDGKTHRCFSAVENRRLRSGAVAQRTVLYLGEINDSQQAAWRKSLEVFDETGGCYTTMSLFPDDRELPAEAIGSVQVKLSQMELRRQRGAVRASRGVNCRLRAKLTHYRAEISLDLKPYLGVRRPWSFCQPREGER